MLEGGAPSTLFLSENWVSLWVEYCLQIRVVKGWKLTFFPNSPIQLSSRNTCISQREPSSLESGASSTCFTLRIELVFEWMVPASQCFQGVEMYIFVQVGLLIWVEETHLSVKEKSSILEGGACSTLYLCENWASFWKEYCLPIRVFKGYKLTFCSKYAYSAEVKKHMYFSKNKTIYFTKWSI
jgi:hypothetical protein